MPDGTKVRPQKWSNVIDLYDDGDYSAIWGSYDGDHQRCLGVRWNENFPNQGGNPLWYVEPSFVRKQILLSLLGIVVQSDSPQRSLYIQNIQIALNEC